MHAYLCQLMRLWYYHISVKTLLKASNQLSRGIKGLSFGLILNLHQHLVMEAAKTLVRLHRCAGLSELPLLADAKVPNYNVCFVYLI